MSSVWFDPTEPHYKKWPVLPRFDHCKPVIVHTGKTSKLQFEFTKHGKTTMNIINSCFTMLGKLKLKFTSFTSLHNDWFAIVKSW